MAEVIFEGGKNPMKVTGWLDYIKLTMLEKMYSDFGPTSVVNLGHRLFTTVEHKWIHSQFGHNLKYSEFEDAIREMFRDGWIEQAGFKCECCRDKQHPWQEILKHVTAFELTAKGRDLIPEHIFP